jgi:hypothetical protein
MLHFVAAPSTQVKNRHQHPPSSSFPHLVQTDVQSQKMIISGSLSLSLTINIIPPPFLLQREHSFWIKDINRKTQIRLCFIALKGQFHQIFCFWFSSWISFPQLQSIPLGPFQIFQKFAEIFAAHDAPPVSLTPVANGKNLQQVVSSLIIGPIVWHQCRLHRRQICRWYRWHQWQICHWYQQICHWCRWYRWCTLTCDYLRQFSKIRNSPNGILWGWG